ncbi:prenyltransferase/squalene oxidase repeat-containing protein [Streptosporangium sp. NBC_01469]|uniref:prenyltransferase/squalene oxidase repeat-containing protein n=1 Tax=Streptosporangium sp. NBC_01469 TaxID=2903898 RepID=UPI002E27E4C5|nr:prenyltransferase/squalene oxidase repeat-containing protein [Streptosporangium sp. NBC_01469]
MSVDRLFTLTKPGTEAGVGIRTERRVEIDAGADVAAEARELVAGLLAEPWGQVSASPYETGRVVSLAPWLTGHAERVEFLLATQRPDGGWSPAGDHALVPTLSAVEALLAELGRDTSSGHALLAKAADRGLEAIWNWSFQATWPPDTPAIELIVASLLALIDGHLDGEGPKPPPGMSGAKLAAVRAWLVSGAPIPQKLVHALEVAGPEATAASGILPTPMPGGMAAVGASPGASAAWLAAPPDPGAGAGAGAEERAARRAGDEAAVRRYLEAVVASSGGPMPCALPIAVFERGWTLSWLRRAGIPVDVPPELVASLRDGLGPEGVATGPGLPADADTTSVALYALALLGEPREPEGLWPFELETHFCTWRGEEGMSPTTNAHVLDAFGEYLRRRGGEPRHAAVVAKLAAWLRDRQEVDGNWTDRWHVSPYYATACCAIALREFGGGKSAGAVGDAVNWVLGTQREDGSWGRWEGTAEETAYALQTLLLAGAARDGRWREAVERGYRHLLAARDGRAPSLWVDKDLYLPVAIVRAAVLGALHLARRALAIPEDDSY